MCQTMKARKREREREREMELRQGFAVDGGHDEASPCNKSCMLCLRSWGSTGFSMKMSAEIQSMSSSRLRA